MNFAIISNQVEDPMIFRMIWCGVALQGLITQVVISSALRTSNPIQFHYIWSPSIYSYLRESSIPEAWESIQIIQQTYDFYLHKFLCIRFCSRFKAELPRPRFPRGPSEPRAGGSGPPRRAFRRRCPQARKRSPAGLRRRLRGAARRGAPRGRGLPAHAEPPQV